MTHRPPHILIAGGGVAAVEAVAALRALTGPLPKITLLAPEAELERRPASVAAPFGFGQPSALPFEAIRRHARFDLFRGTLARVDADAHVASVAGSDEPIHYDKLLLAVGARPEPALEGATTFCGPADAAAVARVLEETTRIAFVLPGASGWALPLYELAIMAATELRSRGAEPEITVVTPETSALWVFGPQAGAAVAALLAQRGIALRTGARALAVRPGFLEIADAAPVAADRVVALPRLVGPATPGLPHGANGFIPVDAHGRVPEVSDVFAAGDATTFPLKQGGLATQQADAAAEAIAADLGAAVTPSPFRPVMRGLLLTGGAPLYLRSTLNLAGDLEAGTRHACPAPSEIERVVSSALVAPEQDRGPLPRAAAGHRPPTGARGRADAGLPRRPGRRGSRRRARTRAAAGGGGRRGRRLRARGPGARRGRDVQRRCAWGGVDAAPRAVDRRPVGGHPGLIRSGASAFARLVHEALVEGTRIG